MISAKQDDGERKEINAERESNVGNVNDNVNVVHSVSLLRY